MSILGRNTVSGRLDGLNISVIWIIGTIGPWEIGITKSVALSELRITESTVLYGILVIAVSSIVGI